MDIFSIGTLDEPMFISWSNSMNIKGSKKFVINLFMTFKVKLK